MKLYIENYGFAKVLEREEIESILTNLDEEVIIDTALELFVAYESTGMAELDLRNGQLSSRGLDFDYLFETEVPKTLCFQISLYKIDGLAGCNIPFQKILSAEEYKDFTISEMTFNDFTTKKGIAKNLASRARQYFIEDLRENKDTYINNWKKQLVAIFEGRF